MAHTRSIWHLPCLLALSFGVLSCQAGPTTKPLPLTSQQSAVQAPTIYGQIQDLPLGEPVATRNILATTADVASGATVSLIEATSGTTKGTTVSAADGGFVLKFGAGFNPVPGQTYYLEAVKGLALGGNSNRAGTALIRIRTLMQFSDGWLSLSSGSPGGTISLSRATTAVAAIANLRALTLGQQADLMGHVSGTSFVEGGTVITNAEFAAVFNLVDAALSSNQDPIEVLGYDAAAGADPASRYAKRLPTVQLAAAASPTAINPGGTFTLSGQNLPDPGVSTILTIGNAEPATWSVNAAHDQYTVTLGPTQGGGWVTLSQGSQKWNGPFVVVHGTVHTWAGGGSGYRDRKGLGALFNTPVCLTQDPSGNLYTADYLNNRIRKIAPDGTVTTVAGNGANASVDGPAMSASFKGPAGIVWAPGGILYVADNMGNQIRKIAADGTVSTLAGAADGSSGNLDGTGTNAQFSYPIGLAVAPNGDVIVADTSSYKIRRVTPAGVVTTIAGSGNWGTQDGEAASASFYSPSTVAVDAVGQIYVADNSTIRLISGGMVSTFAGDGTIGWVDGATSSARFAGAVGIGVAANGDVYVGDGMGSTVRKISGGVVSTVAGTASLGLMDAVPSEALFGAVYGVLPGNDGRLYIADYLINSRIRVLIP